MALHFYLSSEESDVYEDTVYSASSSSNKKKSGESFESFAGDKKIENSFEFGKLKKEKKKVNFSPGTLFKKDTRVSANEGFWKDVTKNTKKRKFDFSEVISSSLSESDFDSNSDKSDSSTDSAELKLRDIEKNSSSEVVSISLNRQHDKKSTSSEYSTPTQRTSCEEKNNKNHTKNELPNRDPLQIFDSLIQRSSEGQNPYTNYDGRQNEELRNHIDLDKISMEKYSSENVIYSEEIVNSIIEIPSHSEGTLNMDKIKVDNVLVNHLRINPIISDPERFNQKDQRDCVGVFDIEEKVLEAHTQFENEANETVTIRQKKDKNGSVRNKGWDCDDLDEIKSYQSMNGFKLNSSEKTENSSSGSDCTNEIPKSQSVKLYDDVTTSDQNVIDGESSCSVSYSLESEIADTKMDKVTDEEVNELKYHKVINLDEDLNEKNINVNDIKYFPDHNLNNFGYIADKRLSDINYLPEQDLNNVGYHEDKNIDDITYHPDHDVSKIRYHADETLNDVAHVQDQDLNGMGYHGLTNHSLEIQHDIANDLRQEQDSEKCPDTTNKPDGLNEDIQNFKQSTNAAENDEKISNLEQDSGVSIALESNEQHILLKITDIEDITMSLRCLQHTGQTEGDPIFQEAIQSLDEGSILSVLNEEHLLSEIQNELPTVIEHTLPQIETYKEANDEALEENDKLYTVCSDSFLNDQQGKLFHNQNINEESTDQNCNSNDSVLEQCMDKSGTGNFESIGLKKNEFVFIGSDSSTTISDEHSSKEALNHSNANESFSISSVQDNTETEILRHLLLSSSSECIDEQSLRDHLASHEESLAQCSGSELDEKLVKPALDSFKMTVNGSNDFDTEPFQDNESHSDGDKTYEKTEEDQCANDEYEKGKRIFLAGRLSKLRETLLSLKEQLSEEREKNKAEATELAMLTRRMEEARQVGMMMDQVGNPALGCRAPAFGWGQAELVREQIRAKRMVAAIEFKNRLDEVEAECSAELNNLENAIEKLEPLNRMASCWLPCRDYCAQLSSSWMRRDFFLEVTRSMNVSSNEGDFLPSLQANKSEV